MVETKICRSLRLIFSGGVALGIGTLAQSVLAQEATEPSTAAPVQRVEITGSSIRRVDAETPSPVQVITADDIKKTGYTSIAQVLQNITANGSGTLSQGFSGAFAAGASAISLRGLSSSATLVLIDGHRMAPNALSDDNQRSFVDISNIPFDAVERIEVLKDGASAVYGSDAMAGVINVILKKSFVGTTLNAEAGTSTEGGGQTEHFSLTHGFGNFAEDGYNAYGTIEYRHQDAVSYGQRAGDGQWINRNWAPEGGVNGTLGVPSNLLPAGTPTLPTTLQPYLYNLTSGTATAMAPGVTGCSVAQISTAQSAGCPYSLRGNLIPETSNLNVLTSFSKKLSENWELNVKASFFDSKDNIVPLGNGYSFSPYADGASTPQVYGGPSVGLNATTYPVTYKGQGIMGIIPGSPLEGVEDVDSRSYRLVADLSGSIGEWEIKTSLGYTKNQINIVYPNLINYTNLQAALNSTTTPFSFTGGNSAAVMQSIFQAGYQTDVSTLEFGEVHASRSLAQLPGGDLGFSAGASYIHRDFNSPDSAAAEYGTLSGAPTAWVLGEQTDTSAFAELVAPVLKSLELDGDIRFDHFDGDVGNATTPKLGFKWAPTSVFALRGTLAKGFRAPNPAENGNAGAAYGLGATNDPLLCPNGVGAPGGVVRYCNYNPVYFQTSNAELKPEKSNSGTLGIVLEPIKGWSNTLDLYKIEIKNQIVLGPATQGPYTAATAQECYGPTSTAANPTTVACAADTGLNTGTPGYYTSSYINANETTTSGIELNTGYKFSLGEYGSLKSSLDYSHMMSYIEVISGISYQLAGSHGPSSVGGDTANPKDKIQASFTYDKNALSATLAFNWISGYNLLDPTPTGDSVSTCAEGGEYGGYFPNGNIPKNYCQVASFLETDLTVYYKVSKQLSVHVGATNLFNRQPPVDLATYGGMGLPYNPSLHESGVMGRFLNAGLTYNF
jgi:iron complex outermembrane receptor protein